LGNYSLLENETPWKFEEAKWREDGPSDGWTKHGSVEVSDVIEVGALPDLPLPDGVKAFRRVKFNFEDQVRAAAA
jgi:hypothetical protein